MRRFLVGLVLAALLLGCTSDPWKRKDAPKVPPDEQYRTGTEVGGDYWIWHCYQGQRVMISQGSSALLGASGQRLTRGACDVPFPEEVAAKERGRHGMYGSMRWPGSPPEPPDLYDNERPALALDAALSPSASISPAPSAVPRATSPAP